MNARDRELVALDLDPAEFHDYLRAEIEADPVDVDADDTHVWPDDRGFRRALYDARRHHVTAMRNYDVAESMIFGPGITAAAEPKRIFGKPTTRVVADHTTQTAARLGSAYSEIYRLKQMMWALMWAFAAQQKCHDETMRAVAQYAGEDPKPSQQAVYEQRDHIDECERPAVDAAVKALQEGLAVPPELEETLQALLREAGEEARRATNNVLGR